MRSERGHVEVHDVLNTRRVGAGDGDRYRASMLDGANHSATVALPVQGALEHDDEVELPPGRLAAALGDHPGACISGRSVDRPFMRVRREELDPSGRGPGGRSPSGSGFFVWK